MTNAPSDLRVAEADGIFAQAEELAARIGGSSACVASFNADLRSFAAQEKAIEREIRKHHTTGTLAAQDRAYDAEIAENEQLALLELQTSQLLSVRDSHEAELSAMRRRHDGLVARMGQLGSALYRDGARLNYLAVRASAAEAPKAITSEPRSFVITAL